MSFRSYTYARTQQFLPPLWAAITREIFSFKNHAENEAKKLVPDLFLLFKKALYKVKLSDPQFSFNIVLNFAYIKTKLYKVLDY